MFTNGQLIFAGFFVVAFISFNDLELQKGHYQP